MSKCFVSSCLAAAMSLLLSGPAQAQVARTYVSGTGDDSNPCSRSAPCATFAVAMAQTIAGGEITAIDSGAFGPVTVNKALTIDADGAVAGILAASGAGITVNAGPSDTVTLRGLTLEGQGTAGNGIGILAAGAVRIEHCSIDNFSGDGIAVVETSTAATLNVTVEDTVVRGVVGSTPNGFALYVDSTLPTEVALNRVRFSHSSGGIRVDQGDVTMRDSMITNNLGNGIVATSSPGPSAVNVETTVLSYNVNGIVANGATTTVRVSNTAVLKNSSNGLLVISGATLASWGNNKIAGNAASSPPTVVLAQQ